MSAGCGAIEAVVNERQEGQFRLGRRAAYVLSKIYFLTQSPRDRRSLIKQQEVVKRKRSPLARGASPPMSIERSMPRPILYMRTEHMRIGKPCVDDSLNIQSRRR